MSKKKTGGGVKKSALVIAAHPDDEVIGCGGTVAMLAGSGWRVSLLFATHGATVAKEQVRRWTECHAAAKVLGIRADDVHDMGLPDQRLDFADVAKIAARAATLAHEADVVFLPAAGELNTDHVVVRRAGLVACRPHRRSEGRPSLVLGYRVDPYGEGRGDRGRVYMPLSQDGAAAKVGAIAAYESELRGSRDPRHPLQLATAVREAGILWGTEMVEEFDLEWSSLSVLLPLARPNDKL